MKTAQIVGSVASGAALLSTGNPVILFGVADTGQTISSLNYMNRKNAMGLD